jgi:2-polyprenyl-3-methyl-5-hydroxy-6-metoxy-1,4-benzoquinol methylase
VTGSEGARLDIDHKDQVPFPISAVKQVEGTPREIPCALCDARDTRRLYTKYGWGIERCRRCTLVYANPRPPEAAILERYNAEYFWNEYLPAAGAAGGTIDDVVLEARHRPILELIAREAGAGRRMLEIGSGAGLFLHVASRSGWDVAGVELSAAGASFARDRLGLDVRTEPADAMSFDPGSFDIAVMFDVIEHLFDPRAVLEAARRALKAGGLLVVTTPNFNALSRYALGVGWAVLNPFEHMYYFTARTLTALLESCGYAGVRRVRTFAAWGAIESMNYRYTHAPESWRASMYEYGVSRLSSSQVRTVQAWGAADALVLVAHSR